MFSACRSSLKTVLPASTAAALAVIGEKTQLRLTSHASNKLVAPQVERLVKEGHRRRLLSTKPSSTTKKPTTAISTTPKSESKSFLQWYEGHLNSRPVVTKMVTGAFLWGLGDAVAQLVPRAVAAVNKSGDKQDDSGKSDNDESAVDYDWERTGRAVLFGFAIHAPTAHVHYNFLEWLTVRAGMTGLKIPIFKAFMEQFVYWSWFSNSLYHGAMGAMQGQTPTQIYNRICDVLWETQKAQWVFWIPIQLLNFRFVPVRHQLNVVLLTSIVWTALLSAWYPPENNSDKKETKKTD